MGAVIVRHRLVLLVGVLVAAVVQVALLRTGLAGVSEVGVGLIGLLWTGLALASLIALNARHPETFLVRAGAFTTPPSASAVLLAGVGTVAPVALAGRAFDQTPDGFEIVATILLLLLMPLQWYAVLGPFGLFLRPDGLFAREPFGSIFVPWEAGLAAVPTGSGVKLRLARPDLVVRRGLRPGTTIRTGADRGFTAWAINWYATRPDDRPAIGTEEGLSRLASG